MATVPSVAPGTATAPSSPGNSTAFVRAADKLTATAASSTPVATATTTLRPLLRGVLGHRVVTTSTRRTAHAPTRPATVRARRALAVFARVATAYTVPALVSLPLHTAAHAAISIILEVDRVTASMRVVHGRHVRQIHRQVLYRVSWRGSADKAGRSIAYLRVAIALRTPVAASLTINARLGQDGSSRTLRITLRPWSNSTIGG